MTSTEQKVKWLRARVENFLMFHSSWLYLWRDDQNKRPTIALVAR